MRHGANLLNPKPKYKACATILHHYTNLSHAVYCCRRQLAPRS